MSSQQLSMFSPSLDHAINVSKVPQRSPFRYPGGKTWFVPYVRLWLSAQRYRPSTFFELFAGGAIVGLTVAFENLADKVVLVERDDQIASVWKTILSNQASWLARRICEFHLSRANAERIIESVPRSCRERAFQTILKNRIFHGGILAEGSGMMKNGENGKGLLSRWYPETIARRIMQITKFRNRIEFVEGDALKFLSIIPDGMESVVFIDPPYTAGGKRAGKRLYRFFDIDHIKLFELMSARESEFLMTYDNAFEVRAMAEAHHFEYRTVAMKNTHHESMKELVISRNLHWLD